MKTSPILIKSLAIRRENNGDARLVVSLRNRTGKSVPPFRLILFLHDGEGRIRDSLYVKLKPFNPLESQDVSIAFRLKNSEFVSYTARLEKLEGTDYSNFDKSAAD